MANIKSAKKRARQSEKRRMKNLSRKTDVKTAVKKVMTAIEKGEPAEKVKELLRSAESKLSRAKTKGLMHAKTASRKISRLAKKAITKK